MSSPFEWSDEERERAAAVLEGDARQLQNTGAPPEKCVSSMQCQDWRRRLKTGLDVTPYQLGDEVEFSRATVEAHVQGECQHDPDVVGVAVRYSEVADTWVSDY